MESDRTNDEGQVQPEGGDQMGANDPSAQAVIGQSDAAQPLVGQDTEGKGQEGEDAESMNDIVRR